MLYISDRTEQIQCAECGSRDVCLTVYGDWDEEEECNVIDFRFECRQCCHEEDSDKIYIG